jgi:hypothetical protein
VKNSKFALESLRYRSYRPILIPIPIPIVSIPESMPQVFWTTLVGDLTYYDRGQRWDYILL